MMKTCFFSYLLLIPALTFGQVDTLTVVPKKPGRAYLSEVLIHQPSGVGVFEIHYMKGSLRSASLYVVDLNEKKVLSTIYSRNWAYLYNSWIDSNAVLHLSKGGALFSRKVLYDVHTGTNVSRRKARSANGQTRDASNHQYIDSQELYCTRDIVYWMGLGIYYNEHVGGFIITRERP